MREEPPVVCAVGNSVDERRSCTVQHSLIVVTSIEWWWKAALTIAGSAGAGTAIGTRKTSDR
jgi:hypothetical protein